MKKVIIFIVVIAIIVIIVIGGFTIYKKVDEYNKLPGEVIDVAETIEDEETRDIVIIKNGKIENEDLIDTYMEKTSESDDSQEISLIIYDYTDDTNYDEKKLTYCPSDINQEGQEDETVNVTIPEEDELDQFGYYLFTVNGDNETEKKFQKMKWEIKRQTENSQVKLIFYSSLIDIAEIPVICTYDLESSNYKKDIDMSFSQRKDMGAKKIIDKNLSEDYDFDVYTVGGDVSFTIDGDMVYDFEKALNEKVVTVDDILKQCKMDVKYGVCEVGMYSDGGTVEYMYDEYTIIKYNTLDENQDLVVGFKGDIRNTVDEILYGE